MDIDRLACPRCRTPEHQPMMEPAELGGIHLDECPACGGVWLDQGTFERIMNSAEAQSHALSMLGVRRGATERKVHYLRCPLCNELMSRRNYAGRSGVIVDFCMEHGLWFDGGELRSVVEFIRSGGLDDAARAAAQQAVSDDERRKSADFWFGKKEDQDRFWVVGPTPLRLLEATLRAMRK
jgi:Zn-finger nucleic acid-binding protein